MSQSDELMRLTLEVGVPFRIHTIKHWKGPTPLDLERARDFAARLAEKGDILQFGSKKKGEVAGLMNELIHAIAVAACMPGGIRFLGQHWEA